MNFKTTFEMSYGWHVQDLSLEQIIWDFLVWF